MAYKILADENIPYVDHFFGRHGELSLISGRSITRQDVLDVDVLLTRSVTRVDAELLKGSRIQFVGSTTIGCDHIDLEFLSQAGITFANAPGSNANSVAEYVLSALLELSKRNGFSLESKTVGIIGYGNVGRRVKAMLEALGLICLIYDPFLGSEIQQVPFNQVIRSDIVTLHVPLTYDGPYPTFHMINEQVMQAFSESMILINTSRGAVVDNAALKKLLHRRKQPVVLDVWEGEPNIDLELLPLVDLATPHIAGYSAEGKRNGVQAVYNAFCEFTGQAYRLCAIPLFDKPVLLEIPSETFWPMVRYAVRSAYDIRVDDQALRALMHNIREFEAGFDQLRKLYPVRREFSAFQLTTKDMQVNRHLSDIGFNLV